MAEEHRTIRFQVGESWDGVYDPKTNYRYAKVVQDPTGLGVYRSLKSNNQGHPLSDTTWWKKILDFTHIKEVADHIETLHEEMQEHEQTRERQESTRQEQEQERNRNYAEQEGSEAESTLADGSRWGRFYAKEARRQELAEAAEGTSESESGDGSRWGAYKAAEAARNQAREAAEGTEAQSIASDGSRWGAFKAAESRRDAARLEAEGNAESESGDGSRWGAYKAAEAARNQARLEAEGNAESESGDGSRWGAYKAAEAARNQARLTAEGTSESESGDGSRWGAYKAAEAARNHAREAAEGSQSGSTAGDGTRWGAFLSAEETRNALTSALRTMLERGEVIPALAKNISSWEERIKLPVVNSFDVAARTTAGSASIHTPSGSKVLSIVAKSRFKATALVSAGYNLLRRATAIGSGWYFEVGALPFGAYGSSAKPNGVLFTARDGSNLKPTVLFKALEDGVPESDSDGEACAYIDSNGYRFFTTDQPGYMIVKGITFADTCPHVAWSSRYDEFIAPDAEGDEGGSLALTTDIQAIHASGEMLAAGRAGDKLIYDGTKVYRHKICDEVTPTWSTVQNEDGGYTHIATIATMKPDGEAVMAGVTLNVSGNTVSYTDDQAEAASGTVVFELATPTVTNRNQPNALPAEDWSLEYLEGASGSAVITMQYAQGYQDSVAALVSGGFELAMATVAHILCNFDARTSRLENALENGLRHLKVDHLEVVTRLDRHDNSGNRVIESDHAPDVMADFVGQRWHYKDETHDEWYLATGTTAVAQWKKISLT